jgi:hypothetical protein
MYYEQVGCYCKEDEHLCDINPRSLKCDPEYTFEGCLVFANGECQECSFDYRRVYNSVEKIWECEPLCTVDSFLWDTYVVNYFM